MPNTVRVAAQVTGVGKASSDIDRIRDKFERLQKQGAKGFAIGAGAAITAKGLGLIDTALGGVTNAIFDSIKASSDLNETVSKSGVVFGTNAAEVRAWGETAAKSMGLSENAAIAAAASIGNLLLSTGTAPDKIAPMSEALVRLASDLASFNNISVEDALAKLQSGIVGQERPLRELGVAISAASVDAEAMALDFTKVNGVFTEGQKVQARYSLIVKQTKTAQGDFTRTADQMANQQRILNAEMEDASAKLGANLTPAVIELQRALIDLTAADGPAAETLGAVAAAAQQLVDVLNSVSGASQGAGQETDLLGSKTDALGSALHGLADLVTAQALNLQDLADGGHRVRDFLSAAATQARLTGTAMTGLATANQVAASRVGVSAEGIVTSTKKIGTQARRTSHTVTTSLGSIADAFDKTWSDLAGTADQAAEDIFGPIERRAALAANKLAQEKDLGIIAHPKKGEDVGAARADLLGLQKDFFTLSAEMAGRGELTSKEIGKLSAALKDELLSATNEETVSILALMGLLDKLRAKGSGLFTRLPGEGVGGHGRASGGPVRKGVPYVVGEQHSEVFIPDQNGTIDPRTPQQAPGSGSGAAWAPGSDAAAQWLPVIAAQLSRLTAQEPNAARPQTARGDLARQAALMPGGRL